MRAMLNDRRLPLLLCVALLLPILSAGPARQPMAQDLTPGPGGREEGGQDDRARRAACLPELLQQATTWPEPIPSPWQRWRELMAFGKCQLAAGDPELAARYFRQGGSEAAELEPVWRVNLFRALIAAGARVEALALLGELAASPVRGVRDTVRAILSETLARSVPDEALSEYLKAYAAASPTQPEDYDLILALHQRSGEVAALAGVPPLPLLLWRGPKDEASARFWRDAPRSLAGQGIAPQPVDYLGRARQLRRLRLPAMIRKEFDPERLADPALGISGETARAIGQIWFWALGRTRSFSQALQALEREDVRHRFALEPQDALTLAVEFHLRAGQPALALEKLAALEALAPKAYVLPGYYLDLARRARMRGDVEAMTRWCGRTIERFPGHPRTPEAYWLLVWEHYRLGAPSEAARWAEAYLASPDGTSGQERFLYWLGRAYGQIGREDEATKAWSTLIARSPTDFYSLLAQGEALDHLAKPAAALAGYAAPERKLPVLAELWQQPALRQPVLLLLLDEDALAEAAMEPALAQPAPASALRELAAALTHLRKYHLAQMVAARYLRPGPGEGGEADPEALRLIYPLAFWDQIAVGGTDRLNPYFVLAMIREESRFRVDADSSAGAKGLMQLMPSTAAQVARDHGLPEDQQALLQPDVNIALGTLYLERLAKRFDGNPLHIAASYNAGPNVVRQWLRTMGSLPPDEFIEAIPYEETQNYVKKVLATSILYRKLYRTQ